MSELDIELEGLEDLDEDVGLGSEDQKHAKRGDNQEWFKGEKGVSYRVSFIYFHTVPVNAVKMLRKRAREEGKQITPDDEKKFAKAAFTKHAEKLGKAPDQLQDWEKLDKTDVQFKKVMAYYSEGVGYVISRLGKDGADADAVWRRLGDEKKYFTTVLLVYPTNKQGELNPEAFKAGQFTVLPWRISGKVYGQFHELASSLRDNDLSIADQDLVITCTNSDYQNFDKMRASGKAIWRKDPKFEERVLKLALPMYSKLQPFRELSTSDLRIKLGMDSDNQGEDTSMASADMNDLFNNL